MQKPAEDDEIRLPYEEEVTGYTIFIDTNPDCWRGGVIWSVFKDNVELDSGLEFDMANAIYCANSTIELLQLPL